MKKIITPLFLLFTVAYLGQNVQDQKVTFQYTQLPSTPFEQSVSTYSIELNTDAITKANEDSMGVYESKLVKWESDFEQWLTEKKKIDKAFLLEMANYEKAVNAGNSAAPVPVKPPYPEQPIKEEIPLPILTEEVPQNVVESTIAIEGYTKGDNGAVIKIELLGFQEAKVNVKKSGSGATIKYEYSTSAKYPVHVVVSTPGQGVVLDKMLGNNLITDKLKDYKSKYEYEYWAIDNLDNYWKQRQKTMLATQLEEISTLLNNQFGFPVKTRTTEIYTVKKHKGHDYSDLIDAYSYAKSGYDMVSKDIRHNAAKVKINKAISVWETALQESFPNDNKSRINKKVTALIYANLAEAYMWINDFQQAENYRIKAEQAGVMKYKNVAKRLEGLMNDLKNRYAANF